MTCTRPRAECQITLDPRAPFSNRSAECKREGADWAQNLDTHSFESHFSGSTAPQAFPRPDRRMLTPARAGHVKAGRFFSGHRRLGLDRAEHDGTLVGSGLLSSFFSFLLALVWSVMLPWGHGSLRSRLRAAATSGSKHRSCKVHSERAQSCGSTASAAVICTFAP
jgi:hypothetical protein